MSRKRDDRDERLALLVARARDRLHELRADFDTAWSRREIVSALYAFQCYREAIRRHFAIEEAPRAPHPAAAGAHRRHHGLIQNICVDVLELLARRIWMGGCVDGEIAARLCELDGLVARHEACELVEIRAGLGGGISEDDLSHLASAFDDARMLRASAC